MDTSFDQWLLVKGHRNVQRDPADPGKKANWASPSLLSCILVLRISQVFKAWPIVHVKKRFSVGNSIETILFLPSRGGSAMYPHDYFPANRPAIKPVFSYEHVAYSRENMWNMPKPQQHQLFSKVQLHYHCIRNSGPCVAEVALHVARPRIQTLYHLFHVRLSLSPAAVTPVTYTFLPLSCIPPCLEC